MPFDAKVLVCTPVSHSGAPSRARRSFIIFRGRQAPHQLLPSFSALRVGDDTRQAGSYRVDVCL